MPDDNDLSDEDKALFRDMMRQVKPLNPRVLRETKKPPIPKPIRVTPKTPDLPIREYALSNHVLDTVLADTVLSYCSHPIPGLRFRQLKKGQIPIEARLDLHGFKPDAARDALCNFIDNAVQMNKRCVLIIHGKGGRHFDTPILKNFVNHWLKQLSPVLAFHSALAHHGGSGAVYVLLKRQPFALDH